MDWIQAPLNCISTHFFSLLSSITDPTIPKVKVFLEKSGWGIKDRLISDLHLSDFANVLKIPSLNSLKDLSIFNLKLVRFTGMVQNILDHEFISTVIPGKEHSTGKPVLVPCKYAENAAAPGIDLEDTSDFQTTVTEERGKLICVGVPGQSQWIYDLAKEVPNQTKVVAYMYDGAGKELKLNDQVDLVGILNYQPAEGYEESMEDDEENVDNMIRGEELLPKIHVLAVFKNPLSHLHYLGFDPSFVHKITSDPEKAVAENRATLALIKGKLKNWLTGFFGGDSLVAEYVILSLLSRVYTRKEPLALGNFPINISNIPLKGITIPSSPGTTMNEFTHHFQKLIQTLTQKCKLLELSIKYLESEDLVPKKSYETNEIVNNTLQLASQTYLLLDETKVEPGALSEKGFKNLRALQSVVNSQMIGYDFTYQTIEFPTNYPCIVLSHTRSLFKETTEVKIDEKSVQALTFEMVDKLCKEDWRDFIMYLGLLTDPRLTFHISPGVSEKMQQDFVEVRKKETEEIAKSGKTRTVTADTFHNWISTARLYALSLGKMELELEDYHAARKLEIERISRLNK